MYQMLMLAVILVEGRSHRIGRTRLDLVAKRHYCIELHCTRCDTTLTIAIDEGSAPDFSWIKSCHGI